MKKYLVLLATLLSAQQLWAQCVLKNQKDGQRHFICQAPGTQKAVHVLDLKGGFAETAYYHGYFLRHEIEKGILHGIRVRAEQGFASLTPKEREQTKVIQKCVIDNYKASVSLEFYKGLRGLYKGMQAAGTGLSWDEVEEANYMAEFSGYTDTLQRQLALSPGKEKRKLFGSCAPYFVGKMIGNPFKKLAQAFSSLKMGCTGVAASAAATSDGALVHGRNFDTGLLGFFEKDQVIVVNTQKNGIISVGLGAAGLHYAGGISGFNNYGISISLHELRTDEPEIRYENGTSDIAPYLAHHVLMNTMSLDHAIALLKERKGFGAWTFFVSDAKTGETASVELSGNTVEVARRTKNTYMSQSNHFLHPKTDAEGWEYSLNKTLETRARMTHVDRTLQENFGQVNYQWVINRLSGHYDELVGNRSFGRTTTKVYTAGTHVMIPSRWEWWMSVGETYPTNRSNFVGFRLVSGDIPVQIIGVTKSSEDVQTPNWYDSMKYYVLAYKANEEDRTSLTGIDRTLNLLKQGEDLALRDNVYEFPYHFMWARMKIHRAAQAIQQGEREVALQDLNAAQDKMQEIAADPRVIIHPYERFQMAMWGFRAETLKSQVHQNKARQKQLQMEALSLVAPLIQQYPRQTELYDLRKSLQAEAQLPIVLDAEIRFGTVE